MSGRNARSWLLRLPVLLGAALLVVPWLYLMWNVSVGEVAPGLRFRTKQTLIGVFQAASSGNAVQALLDGSFQTSASEGVARISPIYASAVRAKGQFYYSVFSMSPYKLFGSEGMSILAVLSGRDLLQWPYMAEYCTRDLASMRAAAEPWAASLRRMQDLIEAQGKSFLYVTTPSKAAVHADHIPASMRCPAKLEARLHKVDMWRAMLQEHGVHFIDGAGLVGAAEPHSAIDLFPRGGAHWNSLAAAMAAQQVTAQLNSERERLTPFTFTARASHKPEGSDRELVDAVHLMWPDDDFVVPVMTYSSTAPVPCKPARIVEIGGSFLFKLNDVLMQVACPPRIVQWFYWDRDRIRYPGQVFEKPDAEQRRIDLRDSEIVLVEENESVLPQSAHLRAMLDYLFQPPSKSHSYTSGTVR